MKAGLQSRPPPVLGGETAWSTRTPSFLGLETAAAFDWIPRLTCPSIVAVHGQGPGSGLQTALACDFRLLARGAVVGLTETRHALIPDMGTTWRLPRIVSPAMARQLILLGEVIEAEEAMGFGLASRVSPEEDPHVAAMEFATRLAGQLALAVAGARQAVAAG
jgi:enoyl-CoA hydratase/carnithine racemase